MTTRNRRASLTLAGSCGGHGLSDGLSATVYVLLPVLAQQFGLGYGQVGVLRAAHSVAMSLFEYPSGLLAERFGERRLLVFGLTCGGIGYISLSFCDGFPAVLAALSLTGLGAAFQHSLNSSLVSKVFDSSGRKVALGAYNSAGDIGKLCATGMMSLLLGAGIAWQGVAFAFGGLALLMAVTIGILFNRLGVGDRPSAGAPDTHSEAVSGSGIKDHRGFGALTLMVLIDTAVQDGFLVFVGFLMLEKDVPGALAAFAVVLTLTGGVVGKFGTGFLAQRMGVVKSFALLEVLTALTIVAVYLAPPLVAFFLLPLLGIVLQGSSTITYGVVGDFVDEKRRSRAYGIIYSASGIAGIAAPIAFGFVGDGFGLGVAMLTMAAVVLLTLPACLVVSNAMQRLSIRRA